MQEVHNCPTFVKIIYIYIYIKNQEMNPADFGDILFLSAVSEEQARLIENAGAL